MLTLSVSIFIVFLITVMKYLIRSNFRKNLLWLTVGGSSLSLEKSWLQEHDAASRIVSIANGQREEDAGVRLVFSVYSVQD